MLWTPQGTVYNVRESREGDGRCYERRGYERGEGLRREEGGREGKASFLWMVLAAGNR